MAAHVVPLPLSPPETRSPEKTSPGHDASQFMTTRLVPPPEYTEQTGSKKDNQIHVITSTYPAEYYLIYIGLPFQLLHGRPPDSLVHPLSVMMSHSSMLPDTHLRQEAQKTGSDSYIPRDPSSDQLVTRVHTQCLCVTPSSQE